MQNYKKCQIYWGVAFFREKGLENINAKNGSWIF
ncbi:MAG: hypothetical protein RL757_2288 [Bacteroidota bacterium]|jgi:hypothetical protein